MCIQCLGHLLPLSRQNLLFSSFFEEKRDNKNDIAFFLVWDKESDTERFLGLLPCTCVLQPTLVHLYLTSSLLPSLLPIVASASLRLLYSLLYSEHINHIQVLGFLPFSYSSHARSPLSVWPMSNNITAFVLVYNLHMSETCNFWPSEPGKLPPFTCEWKNFILLCGWIKSHSVSIPHFLNPFVGSGTSWLFS
jgi:hypothetical protein